MPLEPEEETPGTPPGVATSLPPVHVLIVDDEVRNLDVLESVLESPDYRLVRATTADAALLALIDGEFAVIVLDIQLPGMSGLELAHLIKQRKRTQDIPIIFLTAYFPEEKFVLKGYDVGAVDYLTKPVSPQILRSKVAVFVKLYRQSRALADMNRALAAEVSQRRDAEEALRRINGELEDRVTERTADLTRANVGLREGALELQRARDEALAASRAKDDFLAALSHELRTPLNPVLMVASDAEENPMLPEAVRADFAAIRRNIEIEAGLIDDLLDITRITRGKLSFENHLVDLHHVLREARAAVQPEIERKNLRLELELAAARCAVAGDAARLQQIFWNVLRNAAKFTADGGLIRIRSENTDDHIVVTTVDTGIGMSPGELERIFNPFVQGDHAVDGSSRRFGGLGLGLSIAQRLVEHHGGRISASSPGRGQGSTLVVELPLISDPSERGAAEGARSRAGRTVPARVGDPVSPLSILLVEDHASTRNTLTRLLSRRRHAVAAAATVAEALGLAENRKFDLLVSDIGLPDGDGCALMRRLRQHHPDLPGIALSGYGMEEDLARSRAAGFALHFTKPIDVRALDRAISGMFSSSG